MLDANVELTTQVSQHNPKDSYQSIAVEVFAELITPTPQLLTALQNKFKAPSATNVEKKEDKSQPACGGCSGCGASSSCPSKQ